MRSVTIPVPVDVTPARRLSQAGLELLGQRDKGFRVSALPQLLGGCRDAGHPPFEVKRLAGFQAQGVGHHYGFGQQSRLLLNRRIAERHHPRPGLRLGQAQTFFYQSTACQRRETERKRPLGDMADPEHPELRRRPAADQVGQPDPDLGGRERVHQKMTDKELGELLERCEAGAHARAKDEVKRRGNGDEVEVNGRAGLPLSRGRTGRRRSLPSIRSSDGPSFCGSKPSLPADIALSDILRRQGLGEGEETKAFRPVDGEVVIRVSQALRRRGDPALERGGWWRRRSRGRGATWAR